MAHRSDHCSSADSTCYHPGAHHSSTARRRQGAPTGSDLSSYRRRQIECPGSKSCRHEHHAEHARTLQHNRGPGRNDQYRTHSCCHSVARDVVRWTRRGFQILFRRQQHSRNVGSPTAPTRDGREGTRNVAGDFVRPKFRSRLANRTGTSGQIQTSRRPYRDSTSLGHLLLGTSWIAA